MKTVTLLSAAALAGVLALTSGCSNSSAADKAAVKEGAPGKGGPGGGAAAKGGRRSYPVRVQPVAARPVSYELKSLGNVEAQDVYRIDARVPGTIYDVDFNEGDEVAPDKVLCRIAPEAYRQSMLKTKALRDQAVAQLADSKRRLANDIERMKIRLDQAQLEIARRQAVKDAGAISNEEIELYQSRRDLAAIELKDAQEAALTEIKVLETTIAQREAELKIAEEDVRKSIVQAPIQGTIEKRMVTNQMFVTAGTPLATMVDTRTLKVVFKLSEKESSTVKSGDKVTFSVPAWPNEVFDAEIYFLGPRLENDARVLHVYGRVTQKLDKLRPGYFASVRIKTGKKDKAIVIPVTAAQPTERGFVAYVADGEKAVQRQVKLGLAVNDNEVEIVSGLKEGEVLVVEGANALSDGAPIRVMDGPPSPVKDAAKAGHEVSAN